MTEVDLHTEDFAAAPPALSSAEARELCDNGKATLLSTLQPHLTGFSQPLDAENLKVAVHELKWLQVAKKQGAPCHAGPDRRKVLLLCKDSTTEQDCWLQLD
jgi:hypothetical protein